jgi:hypothetical protein
VKNYNSMRTLLMLGIASMFSFLAISKEDIDKKRSSSQNKNMAGCQNSTSRAVLDINNVRTTLLNGGDMWWDLDVARYEVPKQDNPFVQKKHSLFAGAIWIGGRDQASGGNLYLASQTYRQGSQYSYWPGPLVQNALDITSDECSRWDRHFSVYADSILKFKRGIQNGTINNPSQIDNDILTWPGKGNPYIGQIAQMAGANMNHNLAPFVDVNSDGIYNPMHGDYPDIKGDQSIWWVMNDVGNIKCQHLLRLG